MAGELFRISNGSISDKTTMSASRSRLRDTVCEMAVPLALLFGLMGSFAVSLSGEISVLSRYNPGPEIDLLPRINVGFRLELARKAGLLYRSTTNLQKK